MEVEGAVVGGAFECVARGIHLGGAEVPPDTALVEGDDGAHLRKSHSAHGEKKGNTRFQVRTRSPLYDINWNLNLHFEFSIIYVVKESMIRT